MILMQTPFDWVSSQPIEILFIDGAKSWTAMIHLLRTCADAFLPGRTLLVLQDYKYWGAYWVPAIVEGLNEYLSLAHNLTWNTVTFRLERKLSSRDIDKVGGFDEMDPTACFEDIHRAGERLVTLGDKLGGAIVQLSAVRMFVHKGHEIRALDVFRAIEADWPLLGEDGNLERARSWLRSVTGNELLPSRRSWLRRYARLFKELVSDIPLWRREHP